MSKGEFMQQERRITNLKLGMLLGLLFLVLFAFATVWIILQVDVPPLIKTIVSWVTTIVAASIGIFLIGSSIIMLIIAIVKAVIFKMNRQTGKDESF
jgi:hypothetical protein